MSYSNLNFYFETSAVNYLVDRFSWQDALATKGYQAVKGNLWYLSPITLWEVMLTSDKERREKIIFYCQHLFHERLMNSPSEFIINYIKADCPIVESKYDFHSNLPIGRTWKDLCSDKRRTFDYDFEAMKERTKHLQKLSKQLYKIVQRVVLDITVSDEELLMQQFVDVFYDQVKGEIEYHDIEYHKVVKISILFILYVLCIGVDLDNTPQEVFWKQVGINDTVERLQYIVDRKPSLIFRGPLYQMAIMAFHQISSGQKGNRGLFMDCLHSIYITYADIFLTNDTHFKSLKERDIHPNFHKVLHIDEIEIVTYERPIYNPEN